MKLEEALEWAHRQYVQGEYSDGCTFAPDLGIKKFCYMHDFLIRFRKVTRFEADNLLFKGILSKGWNYFPVAVAYWIATRWTSFLGGQPLPAAILGGALIILSMVAFYVS